MNKETATLILESYKQLFNMSIPHLPKDDATQATIIFEAALAKVEEEDRIQKDKERQDLRTQLKQLPISAFGVLSGRWETLIRRHNYTKAIDLMHAFITSGFHRSRGFLVIPLDGIGETTTEELIRKISSKRELVLILDIVWEGVACTRHNNIKEVYYRIHQQHLEKFGAN